MGDHTVEHGWFGTMLPSQQLLHLRGSSLASGAPMGSVSCCFHLQLSDSTCWWVCNGHHQHELREQRQHKNKRLVESILDNLFEIFHEKQ